MIKLLRAKEDIYWENPHDGEEPFCTKDTWYEVIKQSGNRVTFKNDMGIPHHWNINEVDEDFWTIDFEEGFEVVNTNNSKLVFKDNKFHNITQNLYDLTVDYISKKLYKDFILEGVFTVTKYSNQQAVKPIEQERPYENWKMSISRNKYVRCLSDNRILDYQNVEGIVGFLNKDENMFYYTPTLHKYIAAKVYPFKYPNDSEGWEFVKENCDSLQKSIVPEVNDALVSSASKKSDILETVESTKNGILASFGVPEDNLGSVPYLDKDGEYAGKVRTLKGKFKSASKESIDVKIIPLEEAEEYWEKVKSSGGINASLGDNVEVETDPAVYELAESLIKSPIKSDGGKSDYYKITLPNWVIDKQQENGYIMLEDLAEIIFDNDFNFTNVFKAQKRMFELKKGRGKAGNDFEYDAKKCHYYIDKQIEVEGRK